MIPSGRKILKPISKLTNTTDINKIGKNKRIKILFSPRRKLNRVIKIKLAR